MSKLRTPDPDPRKDALNARKGRHKNWYEGQERRAQFVEYLSQGKTVREACDTVGIKVATYYGWRKKFKDFAALCDMAFASMITGRHQEVITQLQEQRYDGVPKAAQVIADRQRYFGHDTPGYQAEIIQQRYEMEPGDISMVVLPPLHGKTTTFEDYKNLDYGYYPSHRCHVASEDIKLSKKILGRVRGRMDPMPGDKLWDYVQQFGPFAPSKEKDSKWEGQRWTETYFDIRARRGSDERDYSMTALGFNSGILGTRSDHLHCDDLQSLKTLGRTEVYFDRWRQDWLSRPADEGITTVYCNLVDDGDVYGAIIDEFRDEPFFHLVFYPAIIMREDGPQPLWPERWTMEKLERQRRKVGDTAFERNWMMRPASKSVKTFAQEDIDQNKDDTISLKRRSEGGLCYIALDPNIGPGITSLLAVETQSNRMIPIDIRQQSGMGSTEQILAMTEGFIWDLQANGWQVTDLVCESVYFQKGLARDERLREMRVKYGFQVHEHTTGDNKYDENIGVPSMVTSLVRGELVFPWHDDENRYTRTTMQVMVGDMVRWRPKARGSKLRQDALMTWWFAWTLWKKRRGTVAADTAGINRGGLPFQMTHAGLLVPTGYRPRTMEALHA